MHDDVLAQLADSDVKFVVTGGYAVRFHGYNRPVEDLDLVVDRTPSAAAGATRALMMSGFYPTTPLSIGEVVVLTFMDARARRVDVNARYFIPFEQLVERATHHHVLDRLVPVISLHDLIAVKRWRGRPYDMDDVEQLTRLHGLGGRNP